MRILLGIDTFGLIGGSERYALQLCEELRSRGHEVGILCGERHPEAPDHPPPIVLPAYSRERASRSELEQLEQAILRFRPEVLFLLTARGRAATGQMTRLARRLPVLRFVQDHALFCPGLTKMHADGRNCVEPFGLACLKHYFFQQGCTAFRPELHRSRLDALGGVLKWKRNLEVARQATRLVVASSYMHRELCAVGIPEDKLALLPYFTLAASPSAPCREPDERTRSFVSHPGPPLILAPARLTVPEKGIDRLLEAVAMVDLPLRLVVAGTGPAERFLKDRARELSVADRVHFAGWQDAAALEWLYARSDVVAFPSMWNEPFGLVGIEAMAHAKPVVAFDVGGVRDWMLPDLTGLLSPRGEVASMASHLRRLVAEEGLRTRLGEHGRQRQGRDFTAARHIAALEELFVRTLAD